MRRVSIKYARPEMVLERAVYDCFGKQLLSEGTKLTEEQIIRLDELGVGEFYVLDKRVADVPLWPLITPEVKGATALALREVIFKVQQILGGKAPLLDLSRMQKQVSDMVQQLFPVAMGEPVVSGCHSLKEYDYVHPVEVASLSLVIGQASGMSQTALVNLGVAALLQNIGYAAVPQNILNKQETPNKDEVKIIQEHAWYGADIIRRYGKADPEIVLTVQQHHERWNGSGYPGRIRGKSICLGARILAITDTVTALVSKRPHGGCILPKEALDYINAFRGDLADADFLRPHQAMEFVVAYSGELFDPGLVRLFKELLPTYPSGIMVKLNTGEIGIVSDANLGYFARPRVRICYDKNHREVAKPYDISLADTAHQNELITEIVEY